MARPRRNERAWKRSGVRWPPDLTAPAARAPTRFALAAQVPSGRAIKGNVASQYFTFRLERVRSLRERAEESAREVLARELTLRIRGEAILREAADAVSAARDTGRDTVLTAGAPAPTSLPPRPGWSAPSAAGSTPRPT